MGEDEGTDLGVLLGGPPDIYRPAPRPAGSPPRWSPHICTQRIHERSWHHFMYEGGGVYRYAGVCDEIVDHRPPRLPAGPPPVSV